MTHVNERKIDKVQSEFSTMIREVARFALPWLQFIIKAAVKINL